jgi:hypothetical protein
VLYEVNANWTPSNLSNGQVNDAVTTEAMGAVLEGVLSLRTVSVTPSSSISQVPIVTLIVVLSAQGNRRADWDMCHPPELSISQILYNRRGKTPVFEAKDESTIPCSEQGWSRFPLDSLLSLY